MNTVKEALQLAEYRARALFAEKNSLANAGIDVEQNRAQAELEMRFANLYEAVLSQMTEDPCQSSGEETKKDIEIKRLRDLLCRYDALSRKSAGDAWCAIRELPGASKFSKDLKKVLAESEEEFKKRPLPEELIDLRLEVANARIKELTEALQNMVGIFDFPFARLQINNDLANEARKIARNTLGQHPTYDDVNFEGSCCDDKS